ncbi:MAG: hypothetical protein HY010_12545 [Acidobacteria bacterium]|nr:hypothetical protein [Acidobacteriota bacterium]
MPTPTLKNRHPAASLKNCHPERSEGSAVPQRAQYHDPSITKWDTFHYIYAVLHHPECRERYAANLRRELPRIPFAAASLKNCHPERSEGSAVPPRADKLQISRRSG